MKQWWQRFCRGYSDGDLADMQDRILRGDDPKTKRPYWSNNALVYGMSTLETYCLALKGYDAREARRNAN